MLAQIKTLLGFTDTSADELLTTIINLTTGRLLTLLGGAEEMPDSLQYIVVEVCVARFNRIGSEGISSHSVEGESMAWSDNDFTPYQSDIDSYLAAQEDGSKGRIRFL